MIINKTISESIYSTILLYKTKLKIDLPESINSIIRSKLVSLLKQSCNIDLSNEPDPFVPTGQCSGTLPQFNYQFKYGRVHIVVQTRHEEIIVNFDFDDPSKFSIPLNSRCSVFIDENMNFNKCIFNFILNLETIEPDSYPSRYSFVWFREYNGLIYSDKFKYYNSKLDDYINIEKNKLNLYYFNMDQEFEYYFLKLLDFYLKYPYFFEEIFSEYPNYQDFLRDVDGAVRFLNLFCDNYLYDKDTLKSRFSLFEMMIT